MRKRLRPPVQPEPEYVNREVSCGVFSAMWAAGSKAGLEMTDLIAGTGFGVEHFSDPTERVSWRALQIVGDRLGEVLTADELRAIGAQSIEIQHFEPQIFLARLLLRPPEAYGFIIRGDAQGDFACLGAVTTVDGNAVTIEVDIAEGYGHAPVLFEVMAGAAEALPVLFGLEPAEVDLRLTDRGAVLSVDVPPGGGRWSWLERVRRRFWHTRRIDDVAERLGQRTEALETAVAKRLVVEAELKAALDEHHRRLANLNDLVVELHQDGVVQFVSPNVETVLGVDEQEFVADPWGYLQPPTTEMASPWIAMLVPGDRWVEVNPSRYPDDTAALLLVVRDVTDRVQLASQLATSRRLESLGVMATGVAHDFNNLLVPIVANTRTILDGLDEGSRLRGPALAIETAARLSSQLVDQILATTGRSLQPDQQCDVAAEIRSLAPLLADMVGPEIDLAIEADGFALAMVDGESLSQLVTNLTLNAAQSIEGKGAVEVRIESPDPEHVVLVVSDNGRGMSAEESERMTEPFFTTRPGGRGLGLASLAGLLSSGAAALSVATEPGRGTTLRVSFTAASVRIDLTERPQPSASAVRPCRVLLVDDDDLVRSTIERLLADEFGDVVSACDAEAARRALADAGPFDCLVTDLTMPGERGPAVIEQLRAVQPGLPALLMTGAGSQAALAELAAADLADVAVLTKPFTPADLIAAIDAQLDRTVVS